VATALVMIALVVASCWLRPGVRTATAGLAPVAGVVVLAALALTAVLG
jgi:hypothetical protein